MPKEPPLPTDATRAFPGGKHLLRRRLLALLDRRNRVTVVKAEGGAGKTSLVAAWLDTRADDIPTAWVALDENCRSARSFWHRVVLMLLGQGVVSDDGALGRYARSEAVASHVPALVVGELQGRGIRIVIDNIHLLTGEAQDELTWVLRHTPALELIATSRYDTALETGPDTPLLETAVITSRDLALTADEIAQLSEHLGTALAPEEAVLLHDVTQGHVLSSRLSLAALLDQDLRALGARDARTALIEHVTALVSHELLPSFDSAEQADAAGRLAVPLHVDRELAEALVGAGAWRTVEAFVEQGAGTFREDARRTVFSFHPLVRGALLARASRVLSAGAMKEAGRLAAAHLAAWDDPVEVIRLLVAGEEYESVWPFFVREFSTLNAHRLDDVTPILEILPDDVLHAHGTLAVALAVLLSEREARPSSRCIDLAAWGLASLDAGDDTSGPIGRFLAAVARFAAHRAARRYREAADTGADIVRILSGLADRERVLIGEGAFTSLLQVVITDVLDGRLDAAVEHSTGMAGDLHPGRIAHLTSILAYGRAIDGEMSAARDVLAALPSALPASWPETINAVGWNFARALLSLENGDPAAASSALDAMSHRAARFEHWAMLLWTRALVHLVEGDADGGHEELSRDIRTARGRVASAFMSDQLIGMHAGLALLADEAVRADRILSQAAEGPAVLSARARRLLAADEPRHALETALRARAVSRSTRQSADASLAAAVAAARLGLSAEAQQHARRATGALRRGGLTSPMAFLARQETESLLAPHGFRWPEHIGRAPLGDAALTPREVLVLQHLSSGDSLAEIAGRLFVSPNTVKSQVRSIYRKLGVTQRRAAVSVAQQRGLV